MSFRTPRFGSSFTAKWSFKAVALEGFGAMLSWWLWGISPSGWGLVGGRVVWFSVGFSIMFIEVDRFG
jgi:hypothetical protein